MKNSYLVFLLFSLLFIGCKTATPVVEDDGVIQFKIIQLNDVYEIAPLSGGLYGGMARVAHVADSVRAVNKNTVLVLAGDFLNPSLLGALRHNGERIAGKQMVEVMNAMEFDLVTFGNHEFDLKEADLQKRLNESEFAWLSSNVFHQKGDAFSPFEKQQNNQNNPIHSTYQKHFTDEDGTTVTLGFFGVTIDSNPQPYVYYTDYLEATKNATSSLKNSSDVLIGLTHLAIEQDKTIAEQHPEVSFIMGGHEHTNMLVETKNAKIAKADANAISIYIHTLTYNKNQNRLVIDSHLFPIDAKIASKPEVETIVDRWNLILDTQIKTVVEDPYEVIYQANTPLDGTDSASRSIQTNLGNTIAEAMAASFAYKVDGALVNGGSIRVDDMLSGPITPIDIFRVLPFGGGILKVDMTGELLKEVLDYGESKRGKGAYLQRFNFSQSEKGEWIISNQPIEPSKTYSIAFSDYLLKGFDIPFLTPDNKGVLHVFTPEPGSLAGDIRNAIISFLKGK